MALLTARCLASYLRALAYEPGWLSKCQRSGHLPATCSSRSQEGKGQLGGPAGTAAQCKSMGWDQLLSQGSHAP